MVVLFGWNLLFPPPKAPQQTQQSESAKNDPSTTPSGAPTAGIAPTAELGPAPLGAAKTAPRGRTVTVTTPLYTAVFNTDGGVLLEFRLAKYKDSIAPGAHSVDLIGPKALAVNPMALNLGGQATWKDLNQQSLTLNNDAKGVLRFSGELNGVLVEREMTFTAGSYLIQEKCRIANGTQSRVKGALGFTLATSGLAPADDKYNQNRSATFSASGYDEVTSESDLNKGLKVEKPLFWAGVQSNYFLTSILPVIQDDKPLEATYRCKLSDGVYSFSLETALPEIEPNAEKTVQCDYYLGPKEQTTLNAMPNHLGRAIDLGWFDFIAKPLLLGLNFLYGYVGNYGLAIIILTILVKIVLWPLSYKSYKSMEQMKKLQPMMTKIREKHGDDRQKMNEELMGLYKTYKVNPAGGCVPMILQIPVFIGLYQALLNALELRHAPFIVHLPFTNLIWLADLSVKDPYYITPLVMGATMFLQQKMTPAPGDPTQAKIMLFMPVFFTFLFLSFPSGLVVYWLVNNVLSIGQQWWMLRGAKSAA